MVKKILAIASFIKSITSREKLLAEAIRSLGLKRPLCLIDVGSAKGMPQRWSKIREEVYAYGFEPDKGAREKLQQKAEFTGGGNLDSPFALSDKKEKLEINILSKPSHSSVLEPNYKILNRFPERHLEHFELDYKVTVDASDLDSLEFEAKDFMKIDVQGYELKVLEGSKSSLKDILGLEVEIEFIEMYKNQCSFGEIKDFLHQHDLEFVDFTTICRWERDTPMNNLGICMGGDALFLRTPEYIYQNYEKDSEKLDAYLSICLIYKRFDTILKTINLFKLEDSKAHSKFLKISKLFRRRLNYADRLSRITNQIIGFFIPETDASKMFY